MSLYYIDNGKITTSLPINCVEWEFNTATVCFQHHYHQVTELLVVLEGKLLCTAGERSYRLEKGDVLLLNPYTLHQGTSLGQGCRYLCITVPISKLLGYPNSVLSAYAEKVENGEGCFDEFYPATELDTKRICEISERISTSLNKNTPPSELEVLFSAFGIFEILFSRHYTQNTPSASYKKNALFMQTLSQYLSQHYAEPITAKDAAKAHFISASRFSHLIRQNFGLSFSNYLCRLRIIYAIKNYANSDLSVKDIATAVGFNDYCYFSRSFKKYVGQSPAFYFKKWKM